jgi:hypothetical protein
VPRRNLNLLEYQSKGLLQDFNVTVQKFRVASNHADAEAIPKSFPCKEYVIKAQVLAGGRGKGHFDNGFKVCFFITGVSQGCQIFIGPIYQNGENYTKLPQNIANGHKIFPMAVKIDQMVINCAKIFHSKTVQNLPKLVFLV